MTGTGNFLPILANVTHHVLTASNVFLPRESVPVFFTTGNLSLSLFLFLQNLDFLNIICVTWWNSCFNNVLVEAILKKKIIIFHYWFFKAHTANGLFKLYHWYVFTIVFIMCFLALYSEIVSSRFSITLEKCKEIRNLYRLNRNFNYLDISPVTQGILWLLFWCIIYSFTNSGQCSQQIPPKNTTKPKILGVLSGVTQWPERS